MTTHDLPADTLTTTIANTLAKTESDPALIEAVVAALYPNETLADIPPRPGNDLRTATAVAALRAARPFAAAAVVSVLATHNEHTAADALRDAANDLPTHTEGAHRLGTSHWPEHDRDVYSLAIEEAQGALRARADRLAAVSPTPSECPTCSGRGACMDEPCGDCEGTAR